MIAEIRSTVLALLAKENFGYLNPQDFNLYANNAQLEICQDLFVKYNRQINLENVRQSGTELANLKKQIEEVLEIFSVTNFLTPVANNTFSLPSLTTTNDEWNTIIKILCYPTQLASGNNTSVTASQLVDTGGAFTTKGISANDIVVNVNTGAVARVISVLSATAISLTSNIFTAFPVAYIILKASVVKEVEKVSHSKITLLNNSNLTTPNNLFPAYVQESNLLTIYPSTLASKGMVLANYIRYPFIPRWTYITINGDAVFDQSQADYQDFELSNEYQPQLIVKILAQSGLEVREAEVINYSLNEQNKEDSKP